MKHFPWVFHFVQLLFSPFFFNTNKQQFTHHHYSFIPIDNAMRKSTFILLSYMMATLVYTNKVNAKSLDLSEYGLCDTQGDSSDCAFACQEMIQGRGNCIFNKCYCTEKAEIGKCEDDNHESCDALCQDMSPSLIGFCMDDQCNCIT